MFKKLTIIFLICLFPSILFAGGIIQPIASCSTPSTGTKFNEGFLGTGYEDGMYDVTGTPDEDYSLTNSPPAGSCSEGLEINTSAANELSEKDNGSAIDTATYSIDMWAEVQVKSVTLDNFTRINVMAMVLTSGGTTGPLGIRLYNNNGTYQWQGSDLGATNTTLTNVSLNTWVTLHCHSDTTAASSYCEVDSNQQAITRSDLDPRYFPIGGWGTIGSGEALNMEVGRVWASSSE